MEGMTGRKGYGMRKIKEMEGYGMGKTIEMEGYGSGGRGRGNHRKGGRDNPV